jgi:hypothetical protein
MMGTIGEAEITDFRMSRALFSFVHAIAGENANFHQRSTSAPMGDARPVLISWKRQSSQSQKGNEPESD